jgi:RNA polymerase sigma-70 factor, ECF subfamily
VNDQTRARFEQEALPHLRAVYNTALRLVRRDADARDLVQETVLRAFRTYEGFTSGTNARAWLFTILYSVFINRYRREQRDPDVLSMDDLQERFQREFRAPAEASVPATTAARVEAALAALPEAFRAAVVLVDLEDLTYEEAATALGCPVGTLRSRLFRARKLLADQLRTFAPQGGRDRKDSEV